MPPHLVSRVDVRDFGAETVRIGDMNGDGAPDLLFAQSVYETRQITCLTGATIFGDILWQVGTPSANNGRIYSDLPVQIYDWDDDGLNEVLYVRQAVYAEPVPLPGSGAIERANRYEGSATMVVLDGMTGQPKDHLLLPAPADDSFLFADLTGRGRREDLVVKDRYWNLWGVSHVGEVLWHWEGATGHYPAVGDVDGDGRDEVFVGFALIDHEGTVLFQRDHGRHHSDANYLYRADDGMWLLLYGHIGPQGGTHCLSADGSELWRHPLTSSQHIVAGRFRTDSEVQFMVMERRTAFDQNGMRVPAVLRLLDFEGREVWHRLQPYWEAGVRVVDWFGGGAPMGALVYGRGPGQPAAIYDGHGDLVELLEMQHPGECTEENRNAPFHGASADLWGDSRQEVILFGARGCCIYANAAPLALPTLYNNTLYPGM